MSALWIGTPLAGPNDSEAYSSVRFTDRLEIAAHNRQVKLALTEVAANAQHAGNAADGVTLRQHVAGVREEAAVLRVASVRRGLA